MGSSRLISIFILFDINLRIHLNSLPDSRICINNLNKKAQMENARGAIISFVVLVVILTIAGLIVANLNVDTDGNTTTFNAAQNASLAGQTGIENFGSLLGVVGTILIAVVVIGLVLGGLAFVKQ